MLIKTLAHEHDLSPHLISVIPDSGRELIGTAAIGFRASGEPRYISACNLMVEGGISA